MDLSQGFSRRNIQKAFVYSLCPIFFHHRTHTHFGGKNYNIFPDTLRDSLLAYNERLESAFIRAFLQYSIPHHRAYRNDIRDEAKFFTARELNTESRMLGE